MAELHFSRKLPQAIALSVLFLVVGRVGASAQGTVTEMAAECECHMVCTTAKSLIHVEVCSENIEIIWIFKHSWVTISGRAHCGNC